MRYLKLDTIMIYIYDKSVAVKILAYTLQEITMFISELTKNSPYRFKYALIMPGHENYLLQISSHLLPLDAFAFIRA